PDVARLRIPFLPASLVRHRFDNKEKAAGITLPVLIIHGTEDEVVPFAMGERLANMFPHAQLAPIQGGQHNDLLTVHALSVRDALMPFMKL
ncbi:MAG TPA: alpha/beta hydrolase, partial [Burkholderiales bacterium]|nr:alpha/beta hydrolase [Burkholderiales bacterium]